MSDKILGKGTVEVKLLNQNKQSRVIRLIHTLYMPSLNLERLISTKQYKPLQHVNMSHSRLHTAGKPLSVKHQIYQILGHPDNKAVLLIEK